MRSFLARLRGSSAFWSSIICFLLLPWVPLVAEWGVTGGVKSSSFQIFVVLYGLGLGASSRDQARFSFGLLVGVVFSISYGAILEADGARNVTYEGGFNSGYWWWITLVIGITLFILHATERYYRHVYNEEPFFEF